MRAATTVVTVRVLAFARLRELLGSASVASRYLPAQRSMPCGRSWPARCPRCTICAHRRASLATACSPTAAQLSRTATRSRCCRRSAAVESVIGLSAAPLDADALVRAVKTDAHGAVVTFLGTTRETSPGDPRPVAALEYEAYEAMAVPEMEAIAREAHERFGASEIALVHRTGSVALGEPSVAVVVAAPHRGAAFDACRYAIDALKSRVAVWKREVYRDGGTAWVANTGGATP